MFLLSVVLTFHCILLDRCPNTAIKFYTGFSGKIVTPSVREKRHLKTSPTFPLSIQKHIIQDPLFLSFLKEAAHENLSYLQAEERHPSCEKICHIFEPRVQYLLWCRSQRLREFLPPFTSTLFLLESSCSNSCSSSLWIHRC